MSTVLRERRGQNLCLKPYNPGQAFELCRFIKLQDWGINSYTT